MFYYQMKNSIYTHYTDIRTYKDAEYLPHIHNSFEIIYTSKGSCTVGVDNIKKDLILHNAAFIMPNQIHSIKTHKNSKIWICVFSDDFIPDFNRNIKNKAEKCFDFCCDEILSALFEFLIENNSPSDYILKSLFYMVCERYLYNNELIDVSYTYNILIYKIVEFISNHYTENINLNSLSAHIGYEAHYLSRYFNIVMPVSLSEYINMYRINYAKHLLATTQKKIIDISEQCGYKTQRNFNTAFKKICGCTPSEYTKKILIFKSIPIQYIAYCISETIKFLAIFYTFIHFQQYCCNSGLLDT